MPLARAILRLVGARALASIGGWEAVQRYCCPEFGLSLAKLRRSREASLALFLMHYGQIAGDRCGLLTSTSYSMMRRKRLLSRLPNCDLLRDPSRMLFPAGVA